MTIQRGTHTVEPGWWQKCVLSRQVDFSYWGSFALKYRPKNPPGIIFRVSRHMDYMAVVPQIDADFSVLVQCIWELPEGFIYM